MAKIIAYSIILLAGLIASAYKWSSYKPSVNQSACDSISDERGPLIIESGGKVQLKAGGKYEYTRILIMNGGVLEFIGDTPAWTVLRSKNDFTLAGTIRFDGFIPDRILWRPMLNIKGYTKIKQRYSRLVDAGLEVSHQYALPEKGGQGGAGGRPKVCTYKSDFMLACLLGDDGDAGRGGNGHAGISYEQRCICSQTGKSDSAYLYVDEKGDKAVCVEPKPTGITLAPGKGGEKGGSYGKFGGLLYISSCGNFNGTGGTVDVSGGVGEKGADGQSDRYTGGGGAGGGPGGSGGKVVLNITGEISVPNFNIQGGAGGAGGKGGVPHELDGLTDLVGQAGKQGKSGKPGAITICEGGADCKN